MRITTPTTTSATPPARVWREGLVGAPAHLVLVSSVGVSGPCPASEHHHPHEEHDWGGKQEKTLDSARARNETENSPIPPAMTSALTSSSPRGFGEPGHQDLPVLGKKALACPVADLSSRD